MYHSAHTSVDSEAQNRLKINTTHSPRALLQGRERGVAITYSGSPLPGVCAIVISVVSVHKSLEMQARITTKRAKKRAERATQAHDNTLGALLQASPVQSSWVILCQLEALLQKCKAHGSFCANSEPSCKRLQCKSGLVDTLGVEMQARNTTKRAKKRAERATQAHDKTTWSPPASIWSPPASIWGPPASISSAKVVQKQPGGHTWSPPASVSSAKLMGHSVPTWSPPAKVQSSWIILCQLGALLQVPVSPQHACMLAILHNPNPAVPVSRNTSPRNTSPRQAPRQRATAPGNAAREPWNTSLLQRHSGRRRRT